MNRTDPSWKLKILGATVTKNFEILKIAGSRAELTRFWLWNLKLFLKTVFNFNSGQKFKIPPR